MELVNVPGDSMPCDFLSRDAVVVAAKVAPLVVARQEQISQQNTSVMWP